MESGLTKGQSCEPASWPRPRSIDRTSECRGTTRLTREGSWSVTPYTLRSTQKPLRTRTELQNLLQIAVCLVPSDHLHLGRLVEPLETDGAERGEREALAHAQIPDDSGGQYLTWLGVIADAGREVDCRCSQLGLDRFDVLVMGRRHFLRGRCLGDRRSRTRRGAAEGRKACRSGGARSGIGVMDRGGSHDCRDPSVSGKLRTCACLLASSRSS